MGFNSAFKGLNTTLEQHMFIYLLFCNVFLPLYSNIIR